MAKTENKKKAIKEKPEQLGVEVVLTRTKKIWDGVKWNYVLAGESYFVDARTAHILVFKNQAKYK